MKRKVFATVLISSALFVMMFPELLNVEYNVLYLFCAIILSCGIVLWLSVSHEERLDYLRLRLRKAENDAIENNDKLRKLEAKCRNYERIIGNAIDQQVKIKNQIIAYKLNYARLKKKYDEKK